MGLLAQGKFECILLDMNEVSKEQYCFLLNSLMINTRIEAQEEEKTQPAVYHEKKKTCIKSALCR